MIMLNSSEDIASTIIFKKFSEYFGIEDSFIKYEGLNIAGSIKLKTAKYLLDGLEKEYNISPDKNIIIESSSGNLGIALSILCRIKKYQFICITDPNTLPIAEKYMELYGAKIIKVNEKDESGGYLAKRINLIHSMLKNNSNMF